MINIVNEIIDNVLLIEDSGFDQVEKDEIIVVVKCIRVFCYLDLLIYFGEYWDDIFIFGFLLIIKFIGGDFVNVEFVFRNIVVEIYDFIFVDLFDVEKFFLDSDDRIVVSFGLV